MFLRSALWPLLIAVALSAQDHGGSPKAPSAVAPEYQIGEGDVLQISVWSEPAASVPNVVVRPDGKISMPLLKDVPVAGLTPAQVEALITNRLSDLIKSANVTVIVSQINSKKVYVLGAVKKEEPIPYTYRMTVMQALSEAGGLTDYARRKKIYVMRMQNGKEVRLPFDYDAVLKGQRMEMNIALLPGDTIVVPH
jgi:polysaccharide biosynthesis/export protein